MWNEERDQAAKGPEDFTLIEIKIGNILLNQLQSKGFAKAVDFLE